LEHREALRGRRRFIEGDAAVAAADGLAPVRALRREVALGEETAELRQLLRHLALVEAGAPLGSDGAQGFCQSNVPKDGGWFPLGKKDRLGRGIHLRRRLLDPARHARGDREAVAGVMDRVLQAAREGEAAMARMRLAESRHRAGRGERRRRDAAERDFRLAREAIERRRRRRPPAAIQIGNPARRGVVDQPEGVAADAAHVRVKDRKRGGRRNRGIDGRAAGAQRVDAGRGSQRMGARHHAAHGERRAGHVRFYFLPSFLRASAAPSPSARSLAAATSRSIGAMPQLVQGKRCFAGTYFSAVRIVAATSCGVSTLSEATSITPTSTSLPLSSFISSGGTCEWMHSSETCWILLFASAGKISSYWRQDSPSVFFQSRLAWMP